MEELDQALSSLAAQFLALAPRAALVVAVALVGMIASALARRVTVWGVRSSRLEGLVESLGAARALYAVGYKKGPGRFLGQVVFVVGLVLTAGAIAELLGLPGVAAVTTAIMAFVPRVAAASLVLLAGLWVAKLLRTLTTQVGGRRGDLDSPAFAGQLVYWAVITITLALAAGQAGLQTGLIDSLVQIVVTIVLAALAIAFALGSRDVVRDMIAKHYVSRTLHAGDRVKVDALEGEVVRFTAVALVLRTSDGRVLLPCARLRESKIVLLGNADDADA